MTCFNRCQTFYTIILTSFCSSNICVYVYLTPILLDCPKILASQPLTSPSLTAISHVSSHPLPASNTLRNFLTQALIGPTLFLPCLWFLLLQNSSKLLMWSRKFQEEERWVRQREIGEKMQRLNDIFLGSFPA